MEKKIKGKSPHVGEGWEKEGGIFQEIATTIALPMRRDVVVFFTDIGFYRS